MFQIFDEFSTPFFKCRKVTMHQCSCMNVEMNIEGTQKTQKN